MKITQILLTVLFVSFCFLTKAQKNAFNYESDYSAYLKRSQDSSGIYYYKRLKIRLTKADTTLNAKSLLHLLIYTTASAKYNPVLLDTLCRRLYDENEKGNYHNAIILADSILQLVPINLTAIKEKALALKKLGRNTNYKKYSVITKKTIEALLISGDGNYASPFFGVNFFDGITFYGAVYQCYPSKTGFMLDKKGRLLAAFYCYSQSMNNIMIKYFQADHAKKYYKPDKIEGEE